MTAEIEMYVWVMVTLLNIWPECNQIILTIIEQIKPHKKELLRHNESLTEGLIEVYQPLKVT